MQEINCLNCNKNVEQTPGKRKKEFCNSTCRSNYWQKKDRMKKNTAMQAFADQEKKVKSEGVRKGVIEITSSPVEETMVSSNFKKLWQGGEQVVPPMPEKLPGEKGLDYAARKNEWKLKYGS